ncbi:acetyl-hydrolase [Chaetomidium leptoderma]|uniref:Acetyl-hydrolase n=1 Tax=Chaetomidium leptoderma TaxID=669021 RepID=A0AAN6ZU08_9PEZI|nr:acetyl-hydrolase [Chaetomidium leptoderma]
MDSPLAVAGFVLSKIPVLLKTVLFHTLSLSPTCHKWTLRTELTVTMLREFFTNAPPSTITKQQAMFLTDHGVKGSIWVSKAAFPEPPDAALRNVLYKAIRDLGAGGEEYTKPNLQPVEGEWVGYRAGVKANAPEPTGLSEREKYEHLVRDMKTDMTLLYFHGGSYYLMDPVSTRPLMEKYATLSGGSVFLVRYRLAPQSPFPAALLDALVAYLSLLYPPPGSFHKPIPASRIVLGGDSARGNLASVLLQTLLQLHRNVPAGETPTVTFHGATVPVPLPLPAAATLSSPSMDLTRCMQGSESQAIWDYLPPPSFSPAHSSPPCAIWPSDPACAELFCEGSALCHPLVPPRSPFVGGAFAQRAARDGVRIVWEQYEAMPHCFSQVLEGSVEGEACFASWEKFMRVVGEKPSEVATRGAFITARTVERTSVDVCNLLDMSQEDILNYMQRGRRAIVERFTKTMAS